MTEIDARPAPGSVEWWLRRLSRKLDDRLGHGTYRSTTTGRPLRLSSIDRWEQYYNGELNLMLSSAKWREEFADRFPGYSANFMALVVDTHRQRLAVQGIRYATDTTADQDAWSWWQRNRLDAETVKLYREALVKGIAYQLVWPNAKGEPEVSIESAKEVVVESAPGKSWQRLAALKRWIDGDDRYAYAELYLPDGVYKFRSSQRDSEFSSTSWTRFAAWERWQPKGEAWPVVNKIGVVPMVPFANRPNLAGEGESAIAPVASNQDAINKYRVDALVASEYASFRQRWAIGLDIPVDPITGQPVESFKASVSHLWQVPPLDPDTVKAYDGNVPDVKFGEFEATELGPFYEAIQGEIVMISANGHTPRHLLLPQAGQPASADSLRITEAGLRAKVLDTQTTWGEAHEEVFRLNFLWRGDPRGEATGAEVVWRDPDTQSEAARVDALVKLVSSLSVPVEWAWSQIPGVTQDTIRLFKRMQAQAALEAAVNVTPAPQLGDGRSARNADEDPAADDGAA